MSKVTVQGTGKVSGRPDIAVITVVIQNKAVDQATARKENNIASEAVLEILKKVVDEKDLYAQPARVWPEYNYTQKRGQRIVGYQANNTIVAKLRKLDLAQDITNAINNVDAEKVQISGFRSDIDDRVKLENEARALAFADAKRKADLYAAQAGFSIVTLKSLDENVGGGHYNQPRAMRAMACDAAGGGGENETLEIGNIDIVFNINACFKLDNPVALK